MPRLRMLSFSVVGVGPHDVLMDTTHASIIVDNGKLDVALFAPVFTPRVLDHPVVFARRRVMAPASDEHLVVGTTKITHAHFVIVLYTTSVIFHVPSHDKNSSR